MWYSILALTHHRANCPDDPLRPAPHSGQQVGVPNGTAARGLLARPGDERLDADRSRCRREARFRTRPGRAGLIRIEPPGWAVRPIHGHTEARKIGTPHVPLHGDAAIAAVDTFSQSLARNRSAQTGLTEPQRRGDDGHARTGAFSLARESRHKRSRGSTSHGLAEGLLEAFVAVFLDANVVAEPQQGVGKLPMQAFAMSGFLAFGLGQPPLIVALVLADVPALRSRQHLTIGQVVRTIVRAALPINLALDTPLLLAGQREGGGKIDLMPPMLPGDAKGAHAGVNANDAFARYRRRVAVRLARADELDEEALLAVQRPAHDPHALDRTREGMGDHRVISNDTRPQRQRAPDHCPVAPADALLIAFALNALELPLPLKRGRPRTPS